MIKQFLGLSVLAVTLVLSVNSARAEVPIVDYGWHCEGVGLADQETLVIESQMIDVSAKWPVTIEASGRFAWLNNAFFMAKGKANKANQDLIEYSDVEAKWPITVKVDWSRGNNRGRYSGMMSIRTSKKKQKPVPLSCWLIGQEG